jgi:hypothetical protein
MGSARLTIFSDGTTHFQDRLHHSGFPSYDCLAVFTVTDSDGRAYTASHAGRVPGSDELGSRNLDRDDWGRMMTSVCTGRRSGMAARAVLWQV